MESNKVEKKDFLFKKEPRVNIVSKEELEYRVDKVFHLLWQSLSRSFGPYGAPTLIYNYPYSHATKDGFTIAKNLSFDVSESSIDQAIADMANNICARLNYTVGDGTTSAIIATNSIYRKYRESKKDLDDRFILPRDVMETFTEFKEKIIKKLQEKAVPIQDKDGNGLVDNIRKVVYISSNGNETITDYISKLYEELSIPAITCTLSPDGETRMRVVKGYKFELSLNDKIYINTDNKTLDIEDSDIVIFGTKITEKIYEKILKPLNEESRKRERRLIVAAPVYDEKALEQTIARDLNNEYRKDHRVNMVLTTFKYFNDNKKKLANDFAMLMGTHIITRAEASAIMDELAKGLGIYQVFNIDERKNIPNLKCFGYVDRYKLGMVAKSDPRRFGNPFLYTIEEADVFDGEDGRQTLNSSMPLIDNYVELGYVKNVSLGLETSQFNEFYYDEELYKLKLADAKEELDKAIDRYKKMGTFNLEVNQAQQRYYALRLKMGSIEVGGDTELAQKMLKDSVDDAVKAAASAFKYGIVYGCNLSLIQSIKELLDENNLDKTQKELLTILYEGFKDVYRTVITNAFDDHTFVIDGKHSVDGASVMDNATHAVELYIADHLGKSYDAIFTDKKCLEVSINHVSHYDSEKDVHTFSLIDMLIEYSILSSLVFDVSKFKYSKDVINSYQTDEQILVATVDLISLLIVGNQMVITQRHNFE